MEHRMSFRTWPTRDLVQLVAAGGSVVLDAADRPTRDLEQIASTAAGSGAKLVFRGMEGRPSRELLQIAAAGHGVVTFVGTEE